MSLITRAIKEVEERVQAESHFASREKVCAEYEQEDVQEDTPTEELTSESDSDDYLFDQGSEIWTPRKTRNPSTEFKPVLSRRRRRRLKISGGGQPTTSVVALLRARSQREVGGPSDSRTLTGVAVLGSCVSWELPSSVG